MRYRADGLCRVRGGFTLVELLVVVAIIALLLSILLPSLSRARGQAQKVRCLANMKDLGAASQTYAVSDQTDVLALRGLDRANARVVRGMHIPHLNLCPSFGQPTPKCVQTTLVGQLR